MKRTLAALALLAACTPLPQCPDCPKAPTQATRVVCIDEAFGADLPVVIATVAEWDRALCGVVRVRSDVVDPMSTPCALTIMRVDERWQWVTNRPANAPAWTDPDRGLTWAITPAIDLRGDLIHEVGHLLGADHATLGLYPNQCPPRASVVQASYHAGRGPGKERR